MTLLLEIGGLYWSSMALFSIEAATEITLAGLK